RASGHAGGGLGPDPLPRLASGQLRARPDTERHGRHVRGDVHLSPPETEGRRPPRYLDVADRIWPALRRFMGLHTALYRASGGRLGHTLPGTPLRMLLLDHVGAKSGVKRTSPLLYIEDGEDVVIVASKGGYPKHPAWFHNLEANPDTTAQIGREHREVHARVATAEE